MKKDMLRKLCDMARMGGRNACINGLPPNEGYSSIPEVQEAYKNAYAYQYELEQQNTHQTEGYA